MRLPTIAICLAGTAFFALRPELAVAAELAPHRAVYDLSLAQAADTIQSVDGRIVVEMTRPDCETYALDYRFVARFLSDDDFVVTDQQTTASEDASGLRYRFDTKTFVDASQTSEAKGEAATEAGTTLITFERPERSTVRIASASFPIQHTRALIDAAATGEFVYQTLVFDGDPDADKELSSTAIISNAPRDAEETPPAEALQDAGDGDDGASAALASLERWRITESYFNSDSDADGTPQFQTVYTLYENGVTDDMSLVFKDYTLKGEIAELDFLGAPDCPSQRAE